MGGSWTDDPWDDDDPDDAGEDSLLDVLDFTQAIEHTHDDSHLEAIEPDSDEAVPGMFFTVTNPPGTVSVTALANGLPAQVNLAPRVADMTESELAAEILLIARLAGQNALAGQRLILSNILERMGVDRTAIRNHLEHDAGLPSVEAVLAEKAQIFATRYRDDGED